MRHLKQAIITAAMIVALAMVSGAQISVPHTFNTSVPASQVNTNFSTIADGALKRNGGNITGNITVDSGVTIDGVDVSAALGGSGTPTFSTLTITGSGASAIDVAGGINAGSGNVGIIGTDGRIPALSSTYFASLSGANLTSIPSHTGIDTTWATPAYSSGLFTTNGAGGWTVESGDVVGNRYMQIGKTMYWSVTLQFTTVTAATGTQLRITIPNAKVAAATVSGPLTGLNNSAVFNGFWLMNGGDTYITLFNESTAAVAWTASTNATQIRFSIAFEFQ